MMDCLGQLAVRQKKLHLFLPALLCNKVYADKYAYLYKYPTQGIQRIATSSKDNKDEKNCIHPFCCHNFEN